MLGRVPNASHSGVIVMHDSCHVAVQVAVDICTPPEVFDSVDQAVAAFCRVNPAEYTGQRLVVANYAGDPLKYTLCVW